MAVHFTSDHSYTVWGQYDFFLKEINILFKKSNKYIYNGEYLFKNLFFFWTEFWEMRIKNI